MAKGNSKPKGVHVTQSAYRPMARPASRISQSSAPPGLLTLWSSSGIKKRAASESEVKPLRKPLSQKLLTLWSNSDIKKRAASESEIKPLRKGEKQEIVVSLAPKKEERKLDSSRKVQKKEQSMKTEGAISIKGTPSASHHLSPSTPPKTKSEGASSSKGKPSAGHHLGPSTPTKTKSEEATSTKGSTPPKSKSSVRRRPRQHRRSTGIVLEVPYHALLCHKCKLMTPCNTQCKVGVVDMTRKLMSVKLLYTHPRNQCEI